MLDLIIGGALGLPSAGLWGCPRHFPAIMAPTLVLVVASSPQGSALVWCPVAVGVACLCEAPVAVAEAASDKAAVDAGASEGLGVAEGQDLQRPVPLGVRHSSGEGGTSTPNGPGGGRAPNAPASRSTGSRGTSLYRLYNNK